MNLTNYITNIYTNEDIYNAKQYMIEYKALLDDYNLNVVIIGRFFEKLFGTKKYKIIEEKLYDYYDISYIKAMTILFATNNDQYIFNPFK